MHATFVARVSGLFVSFLRFSYFVGETLNYGVGTYVRIVLMYSWWALVVSVSFAWGNWAARATEMIASRSDEPESVDGPELSQ